MTWQPTWRRLTATSVVFFALVLAVLVWRVEAGDDPALAAARSTARDRMTTQTQIVPDPGGGGTVVVPDQGGGFVPQAPSGGSAQVPGFDGGGGAPSTHQS